MSCPDEEPLQPFDVHKHQYNDQNGEQNTIAHKIFVPVQLFKSLNRRIFHKPDFKVPSKQKREERKADQHLNFILDEKYAEEKSA